jgi:proline dehydrogenase
VNRSVRHGLKRIVFPILHRAARSYIAGPELSDALLAARGLAAHNRASTIAFWDETGAVPDDVFNAYLSAVQALKTETLDCYISVKAPSVQYSLGALLQLIDKCKCVKTRLHFDSLGIESASPTRELIEGLLPHYPNVSCTLPGRWVRSVSDAEWVVERGMSVRVVKGQWADPAAPELDPAHGFLAVIERLAGRASFVAVATHNPEIAEPALKRLLKAGTPCELELLYGLPENAVLKVAAKLGVRTRVYVPYGYGWLPYSLSQARKNPRILWWILKDAMRKRPDTVA